MQKIKETEQGFYGCYLPLIAQRFSILKGRNDYPPVVTEKLRQKGMIIRIIFAPIVGLLVMLL